MLGYAMWESSQQWHYLGLKSRGGSCPNWPRILERFSGFGSNCAGHNGPPAQVQPKSPYGFEPNS